jgi:hypothetical protein
MKYLILLIFLIALLFGGCAGNTDPSTDTEEAFKADLLEHVGDTGDIVKNSYGIITDTLNFYYGNDGTFYENENNGIDAYHEGDWILVPWRHISDPQTVSMELFRFSYMDYQNNVEDYISSVFFAPYNNSSKDYHIDSFSGIEQPIDETWLYFLKTTHAGGATAYSDTVAYKLVNKPLLRAPADFMEFTILDTLIFEWDLNTTSSLVKHRLLVFDEYYNLVWFYNLLANETPEINFTELSGQVLEPGNYIWRVDAIIEMVSQIYIGSKMIEVHSGAEAMERSFSIMSLRE